MTLDNNFAEIVIVSYRVDTDRCIELVKSIRSQGFFAKDIKITVVVNDEVNVFNQHVENLQKINDVTVYHGQDLGIEHARGWLSQQWIKLAVAKIIKTPWYVIIDSDQKMWPGQSIELADWYQDSRACYKPITLTTLEQSDCCWFAEYYKNAAKFWDTSIDKYANNLLSETPPVMMHTDSVVNMLAHCDKSIILKKRIHEFGLYWTYLIKQNLVEKLYTPLLNINKKHQLIHERV